MASFEFLALQMIVHQKTAENSRFAVDWSSAVFFAWSNARRNYLLLVAFKSRSVISPKPTALSHSVG